MESLEEPGCPLTSNSVFLGKVNTLTRQCRWSAAGITLVLTVIVCGWSKVGAASAAEGVALVIAYDRSGSMLQKVRDAEGQLTSKDIIASRTLTSVLGQLQALAAPQNGAETVLHVGMVAFQGKKAEWAVKLAPFDVRPFRDWLKRQDRPQRGTPLGDAVRLAGQAVLDSKLPRKHVLVITDGINTEGPDPTVTVPDLQARARRETGALSFHFVAFDVNAAEFQGVRKLGATVVGAADEKQLQSQLEFILEKKILLEDEEPPSTKPQRD